MLDHWQEEFLRQARRLGAIAPAAAAIGKSRSTVNHHIKRNRAFARAVRGALKLHHESRLPVKQLV